MYGDFLLQVVFKTDIGEETFVTSYKLSGVKGRKVHGSKIFKSSDVGDR